MKNKYKKIYNCQWTVLTVHAITEQSIWFSIDSSYINIFIDFTELVKVSKRNYKALTKMAIK